MVGWRVGTSVGVLLGRAVGSLVGGNHHYSKDDSEAIWPTLGPYQALQSSCRPGNPLQVLKKCGDFSKICSQTSSIMVSRSSSFCCWAAMWPAWVSGAFRNGFCWFCECNFLGGFDGELVFLRFSVGIKTDTFIAQKTTSLRLTKSRPCAGNSLELPAPLS